MEKPCFHLLVKYRSDLWLKGALEFGSDRFGDADNTDTQQIQTLEGLRSVSLNERLDGRPLFSLEFWDTLQSRAELKPGTSAGIDGNTPDIYAELPFLAVARVHSYFQDRCKFDLGSAESPYWKVLEFLGLPKTNFVSEFSQLRWICMSPVLQKWFLRSLRPTLRKEVNHSTVHAYGFRKGTSTSQVTGLVRQLQYLADTWNLPLVTAIQDVQTAFDSMPHRLISQAMIARGISPHLTGLHVRELTAMSAYIQLPHCGKTDMFPYTKG